jgi:hypothetical protein
VRGPLWSTAGVLVLLAAVGCGVRASLPEYAVILAGTGGAPLTTEPVGPGAKKLVDVPSGTIVALGPAQGEEISITQPFAGWLPKASSVQIR